MSWRIDNHPAGGLQITHLVAPSFTARWTTGALLIESVREGAFFWTDEGSGEEDPIHLYGFIWTDLPRICSTLEPLIWEAIMVIERYVMKDF